MNRLISILKIESLVNNLPNPEAVGPDEITGKFYQTFKEEIILMLYNVFQRIEAEGIHLNSFYVANITLIPKPKTSHERYLQKIP